MRGGPGTLQTGGEGHPVYDNVNSQTTVKELHLDTPLSHPSSLGTGTGTGTFYFILTKTLSQEFLPFPQLLGSSKNGTETWVFFTPCSVILATHSTSGNVPLALYPVAQLQPRAG